MLELYNEYPIPSYKEIRFMLFKVKFELAKYVFKTLVIGKQFLIKTSDIIN